MPDGLSMWAPCGMLELSSAPSYAETLYTSLVSQLSPAFDMTQGTRMESWAYCVSMGLARAKYALDRASNQKHGDTASDLLPVLEQAYQVIPPVGAGIAQRAAVIAAIDALMPGGRFGDIAGQLSTLLGSDFLGLLRTSDIIANPAAPLTYPATPGNGPGNWVDQRSPLLWLGLVDPVAKTGSQWVTYETLDTESIVDTPWQAGQTYAVGATIIPDASPNGLVYQCTTAGTSGSVEPTWPTVIGNTVTDGLGLVWTCVQTTSPLLHVGQTVTVQGENRRTSELVTVTDVALTPPSGANASFGVCFQANFTKAHDVGATVVTGPFPYWWSTQRQLTVVVTPSASVDAEKRRQIDDLMRKPSRAVDTWAIVAAASQTNTGGVIGSFAIGDAIGTSPIGSFNFKGTP